MLFSALDGKQAIIRKGGVYRQVPLYERENEIYAKAAGGFIRLLNDKRTSHPDIKWENLDAEYGRATGLSGGLRTVSHAGPRIVASR